MKNTILLFILFCCMIPGLPAQNKILHYEYWLDNDYISRQTVTTNPVHSLELNGLFRIKGLTNGIHTLNFRFQDSNHVYSAVSTQYFDAYAANEQLNGYEYWLDGNYTNVIKVSITPSGMINLNNLDVSSISEGMHLLYIRFSDIAGKWSAIQYGRIYKSGGINTSINSISGYRYWIDNAVENAVFKNTPTTAPFLNITENIDLTSFSKGGNHMLNMQFKDKMGLWSTVQSTDLSITGGGSIIFNVVSGYRYWIDNDFANSIYKDINPALASVSIADNIDLTKSKGNNRMLYVQFKDESGLWSPVVVDTVNVQTNVGFKDLEYDTHDIQFYPNPNKGDFYISTRQEIKDASLYITNTLGEIIYIERSNPFTSHHIQLNNVQPGIYFIQIVDSKSGTTLKATRIVIQR